MGIMDKAKFWKKQDDDFGDLSDLGDFGLDSSSQQSTGGGMHPGSGSAGMGGGFGDLDSSGMGDIPDLDEPTKPGMRPGVPTHMEEVQPTQASKELGESLGLTQDSSPDHPAFQQQRQGGAQPQSRQSYPQQPYPQQQQQPPPQQYPSQYAQSSVDLGDLAKEIEIVHAKLDAIRSSLDSINQRLATLERMASGDTSGRQRYSW